jgi:predicted permease
LLFPSLLISKVAIADLSSIEYIQPMLVAASLYFLITLLLVLFKPLLNLRNSQFTSVYQGGIRFNTYIGLAVVNSLYGTEGLVVEVIVVAIMIRVRPR